MCHTAKEISNNEGESLKLQQGLHDQQQRLESQKRRIYDEVEEKLISLVFEKLPPTPGNFFFAKLQKKVTSFKWIRSVLSGGGTSLGSGSKARADFLAHSK